MALIDIPYEELVYLVAGQEYGKMMKNTPQNPKYHPEGNVFNHTVLVLGGVYKNRENLSDSDFQTLCVAAIFHDVGKIWISHIKKGSDGSEYIVSYGHEKYARDVIDSRIEFITSFYPQADILLAKEICDRHMKAHLYNSGAMSNLRKRKSFEEYPYFNLLLIFAKCDAGGKK